MQMSQEMSTLQAAVCCIQQCVTYSALLRARLAKISAKLWLFVCECSWTGFLYHSRISDRGCPRNKLASFHCVHTRTQQPFSVISHHDGAFEPRENASQASTICVKGLPTERDSKEPQLLYGRYCRSGLVPCRTNLDLGERTKSKNIV